MRYTGPRNRLARREGVDLSLKTVGSKAHASLLRSLSIPPGQHGQSKVRKMTEYGKQLREKQKVKRMYGLTEKAMRRLFQEAKRLTGNTSENLVSLLESRLDNVVYRMGYAPTRPSARQLVSHYHFLVNGRGLNIASASLSVGDKITLKSEDSAKLPLLENMNERSQMAPSWAKVKKFAGEIVAKPDLSNSEINWQSVIEFYSR